MEKTSPDSLTTMNESKASDTRDSSREEREAMEASNESFDLESRENAQTELAPGDDIEFAVADLDFIEGEVPPNSASIEAAATASLDANLAAEEIEMRAAHELPDAPVEAGGDLMESLKAIPQKMAFKIGEAAEMVGVKQYVLRYWESEFEMLKPRKSKNNQRVYSRRDVETAMMIKKLLYTDRFSIEGARTALKALKAQVKEERSIQAIAQSQETAVHKLRGLVTEIRRIREIFA